VSIKRQRVPVTRASEGDWVNQSRARDSTFHPVFGLEILALTMK
jgi:hypothetical protein